MRRTPDDVSWTVDGVIADGLSGPTPTLTRGETITLSFIFHDGGVAVRPYEQRYHDLLAYVAYQSGDVLQYGTSKGIPWFREQVPPSFPVESLVVPIEPGADVIDAVGFWGVIVDGGDNSEPIEDLRRVELTVLVLAERDEFADRGAVKAALEDTVI